MKHLKKHRRLYTNLIFALGMVFFMLLSFTQFHAVLPQFSDDGHHHHHEHSSITHFEEDELDACHRSLYHNDQTNGCSHTSHLTEHEEDCDFCDIHFQTTAETLEHSSFSTTYFYKGLITINKSLIQSLLRITPPVRGPPFIQ